MNNWKTQGKIDFSNFSLTDLFKKVTKYVEVNDIYQCSEVIDVKFKVSYEQPTLIHSIKTILLIEDLIQSI